MNDRQYRAALLMNSLSELGMNLSTEIQEALLSYVDLLMRWNKIYNLTAITDPLEMISKHLLDSLAVVAFIASGRLLDVGSGAGLPAIPIALARPELAITALDSNHKKIRFITQVALELRITNLLALHQRAESYAPTLRYDTIIARACASLSALVAMTAHLLAPGGCWLAMKGVRPDAELAQLPNNCLLRKIIPLHIPHLAAERHLIILNPA